MIINKEISSIKSGQRKRWLKSISILCFIFCILQNAWASNVKSSQIDDFSLLAKQYRAHDQIQQAQTLNKPVLVFISFSMPKASLRAIEEQAKEAHAILVIRGFYQNSIRKTILQTQKVFGFKKDERHASLQINPVLFQKYGIDSVPCFVQTKKTNEFIKICGNISLPSALEKLRGES